MTPILISGQSKMKPDKYPTDLVRLYHRFTSADATEEVLRASLRNQSGKRQAAVEMVLEGTSPTIVAKAMQWKRGTVRSTLRETMWAMLKDIHKLPRYHLKGRPKGKNYGGMKEKAALRKRQQR